MYKRTWLAGGPTQDRPNARLGPMSRSSFAIQLEEEEGKDKAEADGEAGDAAEVASPGPKLALLKKKHTGLKIGITSIIDISY